jgi:hypothetical protein
MIHLTPPARARRAARPSAASGWVIGTTFSAGVDQLVEPGQIVAGCRVVPLVIDGAKIARVEARCLSSAPVVGREVPVAQRFGANWCASSPGYAELAR